jgi:hypothetical protein
LDFVFGCNEENLFVYLLNFFNSAFGQFRALLRFRTKQAFGFELVLFFISLGIRGLPIAPLRQMVKPSFISPC